jgi:hypothetical protein
LAQEEETYDSGNMDIDLQQYIADAELEASRNMVKEIDQATGGHAGWTINDESDDDDEAMAYVRGAGRR